MDRERPRRPARSVRKHPADTYHPVPRSHHREYPLTTLLPEMTAPGFRRGAAALALAAALAAGSLGSRPGVASAQSVPDPGSWFLTAALPDGGGNEMGIWRLLGERTGLGFEVDFRYTRTEDSATSQNLGPDAVNRRFSFVLGPTLKRYLAVGERIAPYVRASVAIGWSDEQLERPPSGQVERDTTDRIRLFRLAVGADWFPFPDVGIGIFTGLVGVRDRIDVQISEVGQVTRRSWSWNTFKSGVELQYYF